MYHTLRYTVLCYRYKHNKYYYTMTRCIIRSSANRMVSKYCVVHASTGKVLTCRIQCYNTTHPYTPRVNVTRMVSTFTTKLMQVITPGCVYFLITYCVHNHIYRYASGYTYIIPYVYRVSIVHVTCERHTPFL